MLLGFQMNGKTKYNTPMLPYFFSPNFQTVLRLILFLLSHCNHASSSSSCFKSIISFGDSLADTGNLLHLSESDSSLFFEFPPYGETFFHRPTGRCSDGRLIIDFIAEDLGLPFVSPFYGGKNLSGGSSVNFAVAGANALPDSFFERKGIEVHHANVSLTDQLNWFKDLFLPKFFPKPSDSKKFLETSLVLVGEIGGNDYNHALLLGGKSKELVETFVPSVVKVIGSTITELIKLGAVTLFIPGNLPIGCSATYLTQFKSSNKQDYDPKTGCMNWLNNFSQDHNKLLQSEVDQIQRENPLTNIIYADYYNAAMPFYHSPQTYGFKKGAITACCPKCGPYNVDPTLGDESELCGDPSEYVSWDGLHLTEAAYRLVATGLTGGAYTMPQLHSVCASSLNYGTLGLFYY